MKFPETKKLDPEEMFTLELLFKFPWMSVVVFPLKTISPMFVSVRLFGVNVHNQTCCWKEKTHEMFPCVKSNNGAF